MLVVVLFPFSEKLQVVMKTGVSEGCVAMCTYSRCRFSLVLFGSFHLDHFMCSIQRLEIVCEVLLHR